MFSAGLSCISRDKERFPAKAQDYMSEMLILDGFLHS